MTELDALPPLTPAYADDLVGRAEWDGIVIDGADLSGINAAQVQMIECAVTGCTADALELPGLSAADVHVGGLAANSWGLRRSDWRNATWTGMRVGALMADGAALAKVTIRGSKIDLLSLRGATIKRLVIDDCRIGTLDLSMATVEHVSIEGGSVDEFLTDAARMTGVDVSRTTLRTVGHPGALRSLTVSPEQMTDLGPAFAAYLGIQVAED